MRERERAAERKRQWSQCDDERKQWTSFSSPHCCNYTSAVDVHFFSHFLPSLSARACLDFSRPRSAGVLQWQTAPSSCVWSSIYAAYALISTLPSLHLLSVCSAGLLTTPHLSFTLSLFVTFMFFNTPLSYCHISPISLPQAHSPQNASFHPAFFLHYPGLPVSPLSPSLSHSLSQSRLLDYSSPLRPFASLFCSCCGFGCLLVSRMFVAGHH